MKLRQSLTTRHGRKVRRMLYEQRGAEPADDDPIIGLVDTPELAALIVAAVNAYGGAAPVVIENEPRTAAFFDERDQAVTALHGEGGAGI